VSEENPLKEAQERFAAAIPFRATGPDQCPVADALGRTLHADFTAPEDAPAYHRAIVEGFLVNAAETKGASEESPKSFIVAGRVRPGDAECPAIGPGQAYEVATGSIVPDGPVAVVRMWEAKRQGDGFAVTRPFPPRFFVEDKGCDHAKGSAVIPAGTVLGPAELGTIATFGVDRVTAARVPRVCLFSSGDEVVPYTDEMKPGAIRDSNSVMLAAAIAGAGGAPTFCGIMADDFDGFVQVAKKALGNADMMVVSGGTAVGGRDFISDLVKALGELLVDGVPMRSGRPLIMGVADGKPVVCVAGHPPEALRGFTLFAVPALDRLLGRDAPLPEDPTPPGPPPGGPPPGSP
jgi:molybdenum cofactor synthesis domain-containing protein